MTVVNFETNELLWDALEIILTALLIFVLSLVVLGQSDQTSQNMNPANRATPSAKPVLQPVFTNYKGLSIGADRDSVKEKLGKPKIDDEDGFYYIISKDEQVQIRLDNDKKVSIIAITYSEKNDKIPTYEEVFGKDVPVVTRPDGSIYNLIRYPAAGIWIAYSKSVGDDPTVTVTIQKL